MNEKKLKHLEFIQNIVTRMNANSFVIKGWSVTLVSALFALAADKANLTFVLMAISRPSFFGGGWLFPFAGKTVSGTLRRGCLVSLRFYQNTRPISRSRFLGNFSGNRRPAIKARVARFGLSL